MYSRVLIILWVIIYSSFAVAKAERVKSEDPVASRDISEESARTIIDAMQIIKEEYVNQVSDAKLVESAVNGMLSSLDPHSTYLNKDDSTEIAMHSSGEFEGIGIEVTSDNGLTRVVTPIDEGPAHKAGIQAGDYIVSIDDDSIYGLSTHEAVQKIRGKPNTPLKLTILREENTSPIEYNLRREKIKIHSVKTSMIEKDILYVRISYFYGNTAKLLEEGLKEVLSNNKNLKGIILDLRNNPGGFLEQSVKVSSIFIDKGDVVYTKGKNDSSIVTYTSDPRAFKVTNIPIVVLINNGTASAAEIVAGALQDHKKAAILGIKSFGKGSVQTIIDIDKDKAISLTTSLYYTPSGRSIQLEGVIPDITIEDIEVKKYREGHGFREEDIQRHLEHDINIKRSNKKGSQANILEKIKRKIYLTNQSSQQKTPLYKGDFMLIRAADLIKGINIYNQNKTLEDSNLVGHD